jgi:hypothetical protein
MTTRKSLPLIAVALTALTLGFVPSVHANPKAAPVVLSEEGQALEAVYARKLKELRAEIEKSLPEVNPRLTADFQKAREASKKAEAEAEVAQKAFGKIGAAKGLVEHARGKWIGAAEKGIAQADAALKNATTDAERDAARAELAKWQKNKEEGLAALKERQAAYDDLKKQEPQLARANDLAKAAVEKAKAAESAASNALLAAVGSVLNTEPLDQKLIKCAVLAGATPKGLAEFARQGTAQKELVDLLAADTNLMKAMLEAGGAKFGKYGQAMEILQAIGRVSVKSDDPVLERLALATSLEHAKPIEQGNAKDDTSAPRFVDPVKRYQHYEKAYLDGELDPAFKTLTTWEMRHVVNSDAPDHILAWGRSMLRNYRPDHIYNPDYGWRYASTVRTEVPYGSENVKYDLPTLQQYQNIIMNGGVCGRRAFFGRFMLRAFGIPTWGVTQRAHAALSHWTPEGWVVNLGAGFNHSWWDKDEVPRSGADFLLETQARAHGEKFLPVLRAQWVSAALGEEAYNDRKKIEGGLWSRLAHLKSVSLASTAVTLGPLGQELGEANEAKEKQALASDKVGEEDREIVISADGSIVIPAVAHGKVSGRAAAMRSFGGGMQVHATAGYKGEVTFEVPAAGKYTLSAKVVTVQNGHSFSVAVNHSGSPIAIPVSNTIGEWVRTSPVEFELNEGMNTLTFALQEGSRGLTIKEYTLTPR